VDPKEPLLARLTRLLPHGVDPSKVLAVSQEIVRLYRDAPAAAASATSAGNGGIGIRGAMSALTRLLRCAPDEELRAAIERVSTRPP
jgi:hypothetical protein